jgi:hypothetical protein
MACLEEFKTMRDGMVHEAKRERLDVLGLLEG